MPLTQKNVDVALKQEDGLVIVKFSRDINYLELEPQNAIDICEAIVGLAFEAKDGLKPVGPALKAALVEKQRDKLLPRIALMLGSLRENKTVTNGKLALDLVDTIFSEVYS